MNAFQPKIPTFFFQRNRRAFASTDELLKNDGNEEFTEENVDFETISEAASLTTMSLLETDFQRRCRKATFPEMKSIAERMGISGDHKTKEELSNVILNGLKQSWSQKK